MKFFYLLAFIASNALVSSAAPIPTTQIISPYVTQFTHRSMPHRLRATAAGLVSRIPDVLRIKRADRDDVFLARALEGATFASARDFMPQRSYVETEPGAA
ncbi:hypothetical protein C8R46DRAFT_1118323 [Mycena filopes]|nr:hypothetical protein C8R46DRAFT_1118323 [Mycena filopes]